MKGKQRCKILKEIRQKIADANDIAYVTSECRHKGDCLGTCPKCEAELQYLERELEKRKKLGKTVVIVGLSAVIATTAVGCDDWFAETGGDPLSPNDPVKEFDGDMVAPGGIIPVDEYDCEVDEVQNLTSDELKDLLTADNITREGLYSGKGWAELLISEDDNGNDTYWCPIDGYDTMTVIYDSEGYIVDVQFHAEKRIDENGAIILPGNRLS